MTVLVIGQTGQLATHLQELLPDALFWSRADADLNQPETLQQAVAEARPSALVIAAAYTAVDRAQSEPDIAWRVNAESPAVLAQAAATLDIPLIHVSTDYVFSGDNPRPYLATDAVNPLNVYGATKLAGEIAVRSIWSKHFILRTSWVFSEHGANFVKTMLRLGRERDTLNVVDDQRGRPTYCGDLAKLIVELLRSPQEIPFGTFHVGGGPATTWCGFAREIFERAHALGLIERKPTVHGITTDQYPTPARRPLTSVLEPDPVLQPLATFDWQAGLARTLAQLFAARR